MAEDKGTSNATQEEIDAALQRQHVIDDKDVIKGIKTILRSNKNGGMNMYRLISCDYKKLHDSYMMKFEVCKYLGGKNLGTRMVKGYFSNEVKDEILKLIEQLPRKAMKDSRTLEDYEIPIVSERVNKKTPTKFDLDKLFE